jgi:hypothetical protein
MVGLRLSRQTADISTLNMAGFEHEEEDRESKEIGLCLSLKWGRYNFALLHVQFAYAMTAITHKQTTNTLPYSSFSTCTPPLSEFSIYLDC